MKKRLLKLPTEKKQIHEKEHLLVQQVKGNLIYFGKSIELSSILFPLPTIKYNTIFISIFYCVIFSLIICLGSIFIFISLIILNLNFQLISQGKVSCHNCNQVSETILFSFKLNDFMKREGNHIIWLQERQECV